MLPGNHNCRRRMTALVGCSGLVETAAEYHIEDLQLLKAMLQREEFHLEWHEVQRDKHYDTETRALVMLDYALRVRRQGNMQKLALKGPRAYAAKGEDSRLELESPASNEEELGSEMDRKELKLTWVLEKKRAMYRCEGTSTAVMIDRVPEIGFFIKIKGPFYQIRELAEKLRTALGNPETRTYRDIFLDSKQSQGVEPHQVRGCPGRKMPSMQGSAGQSR